MFKKWLVRKLGLCVIFAFLCAGAVFMLLEHISAQMIEGRYMDSEYVQAQMKREVEAIQAYIAEHDIGLNHFYKVAKWMDRDKITTITLYDKDNLIYDSTISYLAGTMSSGIQRKPLLWQTLYPIHLKDADVHMDLTVYLKHHDYDRALVGNLLVFFGVFLFIVLFFVHRKTSHILHLEQQVQLMQGGMFHFPIETRGNDEISSLARNIDDMRKVFIQQVQAQNQMHDLSRKFASTISHDIRTPLAAMIGYLDILINKRTADEEKLRQYLLKSAEKANQLKALINHLFEHFVISGQQEAMADKESRIDGLSIENMILDGVFLLESEGMAVKTSLARQANYHIPIGKELLQRVLDNVISNILKYADKNEPVLIETKHEGDHLIISYQNKAKSHIDPSLSTGLGLMTCQHILENCQGALEAGNWDGLYLLKLQLRRYS